jgi:hypothetical protein
VKTKVRLDPATEKVLALAPSRVYLLSANIQQYKKAFQIEKKLSSNASFVVVKDDIGGGFSRSRTLVSYFSNLDQARAEILATIVRSEGLASAYAERSGEGDDVPGVLQISFGRDAE